LKKDSNRLYPKKKIILFTVAALIVLAIAAVCIILIAKDTKDVSPNTPGNETGSVESNDTTETPVNTEVVTYTEKPSGIESESSSGTEKPDEPDKSDIGEGLTIVSLDPYSGAFVEDGSDDEVTNIYSLTVKNVGEEPVQFVSIDVSVEGGTAIFEATTIPQGSTIVILEKNRMEFSSSDYDSASITRCIRFIEEPSFHSDVIGVNGSDGELLISNLTENDLDGKVAIYYKTVKDGKYFGGITYSATVDGGIPAVSTVALTARHFKIEESHLMFVIYE
jgi:hypothetical protein